MNETDRELLELAAKAVGMKLKNHPNWRLFPSLPFLADGKPWNPLTDDGDALRLVVRLKQLDMWTRPHTGARLDGWDEDAYAATRRAIVRAAAEIGRGMS